MGPEPTRIPEPWVAGSLRKTAETFSPRRLLQEVGRQECGLLHLPLCGPREIFHRNPVAFPASKRVPHCLPDDVQDGTPAQEILRREHIEVYAFGQRGLVRHEPLVDLTP